MEPWRCGAALRQLADWVLKAMHYLFLNLPRVVLILKDHPKHFIRLSSNSSDKDPELSGASAEWRGACSARLVNSLHKIDGATRPFHALEKRLILFCFSCLSCFTRSFFIFDITTWPWNFSNIWSKIWALVVEERLISHPLQLQHGVFLLWVHESCSSFRSSNIFEYPPGN